MCECVGVRKALSLSFSLSLSLSFSLSLSLPTSLPYLSRHLYRFEESHLMAHDSCCFHAGCARWLKVTCSERAFRVLTSLLLQGWFGVFFGGGEKNNHKKHQSMHQTYTNANRRHFEGCCDSVLFFSCSHSPAPSPLSPICFCSVAAAPALDATHLLVPLKAFLKPLSRLSPFPNL